jgi:hypothetical protein
VWGTAPLNHCKHLTSSPSFPPDLSHVPLELVEPFVQPEKLTPLQRATNVVLKPLLGRKLNAVFGAHRAKTRAALGLPRRFGAGALGVPRGAARECHIVSGTMALVRQRGGEGKPRACLVAIGEGTTPSKRP